MNADSRVSTASPVSTPIADALLRKAACDPDVSDETFVVLARALDDRPIFDGGEA